MISSAALENICWFRAENQVKVGVNTSTRAFAVQSSGYVLFTDHLKIKVQINGSMKCPSA